MACKSKILIAAWATAIVMLVHSQALPAQDLDKAIDPEAAQAIPSILSDPSEALEQEGSNLATPKADGDGSSTAAPTESSLAAPTDSSPIVPAEYLEQEDSNPAAFSDETSVEPNDFCVADCQPERRWTIDYRLRTLCNSQTSYEVGTFDFPSEGGWAPLSMLRFPLDSSWHGLQIGKENSLWGVHLEWLTPISQTIHGGLSDYDWDPPNPDGSFTDLGFADQRWTDGQMLTLDMECKMSDCLFGLPFEVWPISGFRWQRFGLTAYNLDQIKSKNKWDPFHIDGDVITFNQQYYICYIGGQLRRTLQVGQKQVLLTFQGDWGYTWGFSVDHHLLDDFYGLQATQGSSWHVSFTAEVPLNQRWSFGIQADYLNIRASGKDWEVGRNDLPGPRTNGVNTYSDQTSLTAFMRLRF